MEEMARDIIDAIGTDMASALVEYANLVKQLATDLTTEELRNTDRIKELLSAQLPDWDDEDWEDLRHSALLTKR